MSDLSDVEQEIVSLVTQAVYPKGTGLQSVANATCKIYRGWPISSNLDQDLDAGIINVSVFAQDMEQKTTRYPQDYQALPIPTPALKLVVSGITITVGGTPNSPLNLAVKVNGTGYLYSVQPADTLTTIATAIAGLINANTPASNNGGVITISAAYSITTAVGVIGTAIREIKRQKRNFTISFWCPTPELRDIVVPPVDVALSTLEYIALPDGSCGRIIYVKSSVSDRTEKQGLFRRDLFYSVEYPTTDSIPTAQIVSTILNITNSF